VTRRCICDGPGGGGPGPSEGCGPPQLPPYAHKLNPVEPVRSHLKRSLANRDLSQLTALVKTRLKRMQYRPGLLDGFLASTGLDLTPFCNPTIWASPRSVDTSP
jgi:hypothetical protein